MSNHQRKWIYLVGLAIVWGSSFILMKKGLIGLSVFQLGALRIFFAALFLFSYNFKSVFSIPRSKWKWILVTSVLSTFLPVFMFALAQTKIDSSVAAILNSLVPLFALVTGFLFFQSQIIKRQLFGVFIGLLGTVSLIFIGGEVGGSQNNLYGLFIITASMGYAFNINIIKNYLSDVSAVAITVGNFSLLFIPSILILYFTSFFTVETLSNTIVQTSIFYIALLSLFGTAIAKVIFNQLIKISSPVFSASVTYLIPIVAIFWGIYDGEQLSLLQVLGALTILFGVYLVNKKRK